MATIPYTTLQDILEEAGFVTDVHGEMLNGLTDGVNRKFTFANKPLVDSDYDDEVTIQDVQIYVNGVPVNIVDIDARFGIVTIDSSHTPAENDEVTGDYRYSAVSMSFVEKRREEAEERIDNRMRLVDSCAPYGVDNAEVPKTVRNITRQFAAAWLLIRDYGFNQDIEGTSKDGYKRLEETAEKALEKYAMLGGKCGTDGNGTPSGGSGTFVASSDGDLFPEPDLEDACPLEKDW